ncbi:MAG: hypothetical protein ACREPB_10245, partial [Arenimonas sp.]
MKTNPRKATSVKFLCELDVRELAEAVSNIPASVWDAENSHKPNKFEALDKTQHIVFRFVKSVQDHKES